MIGFYDSGIGGLFVLKECRKLLPHAHFFYLADDQNVPYGNKRKKQLLDIIEANCRLLINHGATIIVFACNTITAVAIDVMRKKFTQITFVGIEPSIKPALKAGHKSILVVATHNTFKYNSFLHQFKNHTYVHFKASKTLAKSIEEHMGNLAALRPRLKTMFKVQLQQKYDALVLGCTHYSFVKQELLKLLNIKACYESSAAVAQQVFLHAGTEAFGDGKTEWFFTKQKEKEKQCVAFMEV